MRVLCKREGNTQCTANQPARGKKPYTRSSNQTVVPVSQVRWYAVQHQAGSHQTEELTMRRRSRKSPDGGAVYA
ncbi:hypothetical protein SKAU_G00151210 [Synaphobranchus kaupii]|uniref:Uncharacterized protein n=1 Tax=Synaphobranchus kaupii TaxID=118154 RepID=A0A9Q1FGS4_SYNKA|nr:hypothetical protein SKAU_G00151210 [Synaphobranchus kaupii]